MAVIFVCIFLCIWFSCICIWLTVSCFHFQVGGAVSPAVYRQRLLKTDGEPTKMDNNAKNGNDDDDYDEDEDDDDDDEDDDDYL